MIEVVTCKIKHFANKTSAKMF